MGDWTDNRRPVSPVLTPWSPESLGHLTNLISAGNLAGATTQTWSTNNLAYLYPFTLTDWATARELFWFVGGTSSGNIDVGIYTSQGQLIVGAGTTAMSATVNTVQILPITDTELPPGDYFLAGACSTTAGTVMGVKPSDELLFCSHPVYDWATGGLPLGATASPALSTNTTPLIAAIGIQFHTTM
jgi:hypothetical protein